MRVPSSSNYVVSIAIVIAWLLFNAVSFMLYYSDKKRAVQKYPRIAEKTLLGWSFFGGLGAFLAMVSFRHKTKHKNFKILVPIFAVLSVAEVFLILTLN